MVIALLRKRYKTIGEFSGWLTLVRDNPNFHRL